MSLDVFMSLKLTELEARAAQAEQYARGFGVTGYNYDTTNTKAIDGKYFKNMYNEYVQRIR